MYIAINQRHLLDNASRATFLEDAAVKLRGCMLRWAQADSLAA